MPNNSPILDNNSLVIDRLYPEQIGIDRSIHICSQCGNIYRSKLQILKLEYQSDN